MLRSCINICKKASFFDESINYLKKEKFDIVLIGSGNRQIVSISPTLKRIIFKTNLKVSNVISRNSKTGKILAKLHNAQYLKSFKLLKFNQAKNFVAIVSVSNSEKFFLLLNIILFNRNKFRFLICESTLTSNFITTFFIDLLSRLSNLPIFILSDQSFYPEAFAISNVMDKFNISGFKLIVNMGSELTYHFLSRLTNLNLNNYKNLFNNNFKYIDYSLRRYGETFNPNDYLFKNDYFQISRYYLIINNIQYPLKYKFSYLENCLDPNSIIQEIYFNKEKKISIWKPSNHILIKNLSKKEIGLTYSLLLSLCAEYYEVGYESRIHFSNHMYSVIIGLKNKLIDILS